MALTSCSDDDLPAINYPVVDIDEVTEIRSDGATFNSGIIQINNNNIIEYGFVYGKTKNPAIESGYKIVFDTPLNSTLFSYRMNRGLENRFEYFVRAFVRSESFLSYSENKSFISLGSNPPVISDVQPRKIKKGEKLYITGSNFAPTGNSVQFIGQNITIVDVKTLSQFKIEAVVPELFNDDAFNVRVKTAGMSGKFDTKIIVID